MDKSKLIWGIVCLAIAALLAVLNVTLPPENLMFRIGDENMPYLPPIILGVVGIVLLATAGRPSEGPREAKAAPVLDEGKAALNKRLEGIGWGCFLIMLGGFALVPQDTIPKGYWSIGVGVIMLGLNVLRYMNNIKMSGFTTFLGVISLIGGVLEVLGVTDLEGGILLIILGAYLLAKPWFDSRRLFGKAEES